MSQNPYLPDGCTDSDLDRAVGDYPDDDEECEHGVPADEYCDECDDEREDDEC